MDPSEITNGRYIGDAVYVSFDGHQFWLAVSDHRNKVVALEPGVFNELVRYRDEVMAHYKEMMS